MLFRGGRRGADADAEEVDGGECDMLSKELSGVEADIVDNVSSSSCADAGISWVSRTEASVDRYLVVGAAFKLPCQLSEYRHCVCQKEGHARDCRSAAYNKVSLS